MYRPDDISDSFDAECKASLFLGDCLEFLPTIPDESIQLVVTSPPYNMRKDYEKSLEIDSYLEQQRLIIDECFRVLRPTGSICWQLGNYVKNGEIIPLDVLLYPAFRANNLQMRNRIIWHFGHGFHSSNRFSGRYETINWFTKTNNYTFNLDQVRVPQKYPGKKYSRGSRKGEYSGNPKGKNPSDVWDIPNVKSRHIEKTHHPCQFPISLVQRLVLSMSNEGELVLDPFMGVGSAPAAAVLCGRKGVGSELVEAYHKLAVERVQMALQGTLPFREDKPVFVPSDGLAVARNPWTEHEGGKERSS
ncbi:MAG: site-specific DNA-methyltransferase [Caldilineaceae bacterium]|nr:site-specific DNA-methyltransferase [Caldilineaceae bacterium]MDE0336875.1 site-specific DNA-methyltransferase [Caldilineaceae bacterium]